MIMDNRVTGFSGFVNGNQLVAKPLLVLPNQNPIVGPVFENSLLDHELNQNGYAQFDSIEPDNEEDTHEDCEFSDSGLSYISNFLMEDDIEDITDVVTGNSLDLQAAEKSFYDVLGKKYPPSPEPHNEQTFTHQGNGWKNGNLGVYDSYRVVPVPCASQLSYCSSNSGITSVDGVLDSPSSSVQVPVWKFNMGFEEAGKFLPTSTELFDVNRLSCDVALKIEKKDEDFFSPSESRGRKNRKNSCSDDVDLEEMRSYKRSAIYTETTIRSKMFDDVLLCTMGKGLSDWSALRNALKDGTSKKSRQNIIKSKEFVGGKNRIKKQNVKEIVDLRTLLIRCAQAVAADDRRSANELIRQIRQHSSPFGDGNQRLAHCFSDGLEARLAGTGSQIYKSFVKKKTSGADILKAYRLHIAACPFKKLATFTANRTILSVVENNKKLHIIDFGILYGFQWPTLIQKLALWPGGPPSVRITGIDLPQPGFRPAELVEETGSRLKAYAEYFKVPFEYNAIVKKWETIKLEDLKIDKDDILVVNSIYRSKNSLDENLAKDSSRDIFIDFVRKMNPSIFIHGVVNGAYNAPFFVTRFKEALFHFSAMFDMLENIVPREDCERLLIEKEFYGREALNVIACEGWERIERPETYKQWQVRNLRAGFAQIGFDRDTVERAISRVKSSYHKDFLIDEDGFWMLQGWKGRILYVLSAWKPA